jgi:hypothetical protein
MSGENHDELTVPSRNGAGPASAARCWTPRSGALGPALHMQMVHSASWAVRPAIGDSRVSESPACAIAFVSSPAPDRTPGLPRSGSSAPASTQEHNADEVDPALRRHHGDCEGRRLVPASGDQQGTVPLVMTIDLDRLIAPALTLAILRRGHHADAA